MALDLTADERKQYTAIIDNLLEEADISTVSRKTIRQGLESELGGKSLSDQKSAIKALIEARFDLLTTQPSPKRTGSEAASEEDDNEDEIDDRPTKRIKRERSLEDDAKLAAKLQAQENSLARGRATRGAAGGKATATAADKPKKKARLKRRSPKKIRPGESGNDSDGTTVAKKRGGGFQKPFNLSVELTEVCGGETQLPRTKVVKKLWEYIKSNSLQNPDDKRQILCDDKLQRLFKNDKVDMFSMNKFIGAHLFPVEES